MRNAPGTTEQVIALFLPGLLHSWAALFTWLNLTLRPLCPCWTHWLAVWPMGWLLWQHFLTPSPLVAVGLFVLHASSCRLSKVGVSPPCFSTRVAFFPALSSWVIWNLVQYWGQTVPCAFRAPCMEFSGKIDSGYH